MLAFTLFALPLLAVASAQSVGSCKNEFNGYCCHGSIISSDGSGDISKLICCDGDPIDNSINIGSVSTCTAGTAVPLTQESSVGEFTNGGDSTTMFFGSPASTSGASASTTATSAASAASSGSSTGTRSTGTDSSRTSAATAAATSAGSAVYSFGAPSQLQIAFVCIAGSLVAVL